MSKIWTKEDIVFDDIPSDIQLKDEYILKDELITVEDWVHEYIFDEGLIGVIALEMPVKFTNPVVWICVIAV